MSLWHYIGEFLLFRWLFRTHGRDKDRSDTVEDTRAYTNKGKCHYHSEAYDHTSYHEHWQSDDDFLEEQEDYDMMDDF